MVKNKNLTDAEITEADKIIRDFQVKKNQYKQQEIIKVTPEVTFACIGILMYLFYLSVGWLWIKTFIAWYCGIILALVGLATLAQIILKLFKKK